MWTSGAAIIIQVELAEGVRKFGLNLDVLDIDAAWLGTLDLRISMNLDEGVGVRKPRARIAWDSDYIRRNIDGAKEDYVWICFGDTK